MPQLTHMGLTLHAAFVCAVNVCIKGSTLVEVHMRFTKPSTHQEEEEGHQCRIWGPWEFLWDFNITSLTPTHLPRSSSKSTPAVEGRGPLREGWICAFVPLASGASDILNASRRLNSKAQSETQRARESERENKGEREMVRVGRRGL